MTISFESNGYAYVYEDNRLIAKGKPGANEGEDGHSYILDILLQEVYSESGNVTSKDLN